MKKLFISCPMKGRTEENIRASIEKMHKLAEAMAGEELEVIPSYIEDSPPQNINEALWYLGRSIQFMSKADYFIGIVDFANGWKGCEIEHHVASAYGIKGFYVDVHIVAPDITGESKVNTVRSLNAF